MVNNTTKLALRFAGIPWQRAYLWQSGAVLRDRAHIPGATFPSLNYREKILSATLSSVMSPKRGNLVWHLLWLFYLLPSALCSGYLPNSFLIPLVFFLESGDGGVKSPPFGWGGKLARSRCSEDPFSVSAVKEKQTPQ